MAYALLFEGPEWPEGEEPPGVECSRARATAIVEQMLGCRLLASGSLSEDMSAVVSSLLQTAGAGPPGTFPAQHPPALVEAAMQRTG